MAHSKRFGGAVRVMALGLVVAMGAGWFVVGRQKGLIPPIRDALRTRMGVGNGKASAVWTHLRADGTSSLTALIGYQTAISRSSPESFRAAPDLCATTQ